MSKIYRVIETREGCGDKIFDFDTYHDNTEHHSAEEKAKNHVDEFYRKLQDPTIRIKIEVLECSDTLNYKSDWANPEYKKYMEMDQSQLAKQTLFYKERALYKDILAAFCCALEIEEVEELMREDEDHFIAIGKLLASQMKNAK